MENFVGLLYNSGTTQEGLGYKNGFGSVYAISGFSTGYTSPYNGDKAQVNIVGIDEKILETEGFIFWTKFKITSPLASAFNYFVSYSAYFGPLNSGFSFSVGNAGMGFSLCNAQNSTPGLTIPISDNTALISFTSETSSTFNVLIYKNPSKNFTDASAYTTYANRYKRVHPTGIPYIYNRFLINGTPATPIRCFYKGNYPGVGSYPDTVILNANIFNIGMAKTTMTPDEFDLFAQKMLKYDNYWHLFEGETDTPNLNPSQVIFYTPFYQKFGGNSSKSSSINMMYPKTGITAYTISDTTEGFPDFTPNRSKLKMTLGPLNRWRKPYPPFDPYI